MNEPIQLREFLEQRLDAMDKAVSLAVQDINRRLEEMNAIREQINNERGTYVLREAYEEKTEAMKTAFDTRIKALEASKSNSEGRTWMLVAGLGFFFSLVQIAIYFLSHKSQ